MKAMLQIVAGLWLTSMLIGCNQESEEQGHVHHEFPEHRPANLKEAVSAIASRAHMLAHHGGKRDSSNFQEFVDIINWVPEMAADSDLDQQQWETANAAAVRLKDRVTAKQLELKKLESIISDDLKVLKDLVPKAGKPEPDLYHHDHDHDHDHGHGHDHDHGPDSDHSH